MANEDQKRCHNQCIFLHQEGLPVPETCDEHQPPCLLQHAALTTYEVLLNQFSFLRKAKGLLPYPPLPRPHWHKFPTFETQLPLLFCRDSQAVVTKVEMVMEIIPADFAGGPN
jgi:hypothetical protein